MGMTTQAEWNDIANKIKNKIDTLIGEQMAEHGDDLVINTYKGVFDRAVIFIIEPNPVGYNYKVIGDGRTAYVALDKIDTDGWALDILTGITQNSTFSVPTYTPLYTNPATITQGTPNGLAFAGSVTIKSDDTYTPAEWDAVVAKVVAALNRGYSVDDGDGLNELMFEDVFNRGNSSVDIEVLVLKSASYNIEVKSGEYGKLYLKESSLDTLSASTVKDAVWTMSDGLNGVDGEYQA